MILVGAGLAAASARANLAEVYAAYGLGIGLGVGCSYVPAMGAVQRWFVTHRGFASGLAVSGIGAGTLVVPPLAALLIAHLGWRSAYLVLGVFAAVVGAGMALLIENDPRDRGLRPDGDASANRCSRAPHAAAGLPIARSGQIASNSSVSMPRACSARWACSFLSCISRPMRSITASLRSAAVLLVSVIGIGSTVGRFLLGGLADRLGRRLHLVPMFAGMAVELVIWVFSTTFWPLAIFAFVFGTAYGGWVALLPSVVMDYFGGRNVSGIIGVSIPAPASAP